MKPAFGAEKVWWASPHRLIGDISILIQNKKCTAPNALQPIIEPTEKPKKVLLDIFAKTVINLGAIDRSADQQKG